MGNKKSPHPDWALKEKRPGTELRKINGKYYLYQISSKYNPSLKRAQKITGKIIGRITETEGFIESDKNKLRQLTEKKIDIDSIRTKEYGLTKFMELYGEDIKKKLKEYYPEIWEEILLISYCRLGYNSAIKNMPFHISKSYMSENHKRAITEKKISEILREIGKRREKAVKYMQSFVRTNDHVIVDMTNIFSSSTKIPMVRAGYNSDLIFDTQFNLIYIFSMELRSPIFYRLYGGNIKDVKGFKLLMQESEIKDVIIIADKGFYSESNIKNLEENNLRFIIPVRRSNQIIEYDKIESGKIKNGNKYFKHESRYIWYYSEDRGEKKIHIYLDERLKNMEETDYLNRISSHPEDYTLEKYHQKKERFGTIGIYTNITNLTEKQIYETYKSRMNIELMFDGMKNILDCDRTYMQNEDALQGWMFINHIVLQFFHRLYLTLKENEIIDKYSTNDMITHLKEIRMVKIENSWFLEPITLATQKMFLKLGLHIT